MGLSLYVAAHIVQEQVRLARQTQNMGRTQPLSPYSTHQEPAVRLTTQFNYRNLARAGPGFSFPHPNELQLKKITYREIQPHCVL